MRDTNSISKSKLNMDGILGLFGDSVNFKIPKLDLNLRGSSWTLPTTAEFAYATKYLKITDFILKSGNQIIAINTKN